MGGEREGQELIDACADTDDAARGAFDDTCAERSGVTLTLVDLNHGIGQLTDAEKDVAEAATEFGGGTLIIHGRILNVSEGRSGECHGD